MTGIPVRRLCRRSTLVYVTVLKRALPSSFAVSTGVLLRFRNFLDADHLRVWEALNPGVPLAVNCFQLVELILKVKLFELRVCVEDKRGPRESPCPP